MTRAVPQAALDLVKTSEGFRATRNADPAGHSEIGYGHKMAPNDPLWNVSLNEPSAEEIAEADLEARAQQIESVLGPAQVALLADGQWAALLDFVYNLGIGTFEVSTLCAKVKAGTLAAAGMEFNRWVYGGSPAVRMGGLVTRRAAETALWNS